MQVSLTGASGFVGQNLSVYLKENKIAGNVISRIDLESGTLGRFDNSSTIIHLAGKAHDLKNTTNSDEYYRVNYKLTRKLYDAFLQSKAKKFIFISSVKAVADMAEGRLSEECDSNPETHYGKSKLLAEQYIQAQLLPPDKRYYILRPCMIHGPGNKGNLNLLYKFVKKKIPYPLSAFENKRSFLSVENLCFVIKEIIENDLPSGIFHIADDESLSTRELIKEIALNIGVQPKLWPIPKPFIRQLAKIGDLLRLPLNTERLGKLTADYEVSNDKIKAVIGKQLPVSSRAGLRKTILSFKGRYDYFG
jgi:nucleoside-diphosphate-sugar epimerase